MSEHRGERRGVRRVHISEAAETLGVSKDAVRMRIRRGTLESDKGEDGRVYVYLYADQERDHDSVHPESEVQTPALVEAKDQQIASLEDQIDFLRRQLEAEREANSENRRIIAGLTNRIPQLEAPQQGQESAQEPEQGEAGVQDRGEPESRPWWRRVFGG